MNDSFVAMLNLFKVISVVIFIGHWIACIFFSIGSSELTQVKDCWITLAGIQEKPVD